MEERGGQSGWGGYSFHTGGKASYLIENAVGEAASRSEEEHEEGGDARHKKDRTIPLISPLPLPSLHNRRDVYLPLHRLADVPLERIVLTGIVRTIRCFSLLGQATPVKTAAAPPFEPRYAPLPPIYQEYKTMD